MKRTYKLGVMLFSILLLTGALSAQQPGYKVVVNADNPVSSLNKKEVSNLFLKKVTKWSNDQDVLPVDLLDTSSVRDKFSRDIHGRKVSSIKAYWQKQIFSGRKIPPPEKKSQREVLEFVQNNPGAVGYISVSTSESNFKVKVVKIVE
jgi:ABC-type phosphate transport system substrate-binding protein